MAFENDVATCKLFERLLLMAGEKNIEILKDNFGFEKGCCISATTIGEGGVYSFAALNPVIKTRITKTALSEREKVIYDRSEEYRKG